MLWRKGLVHRKGGGGRRPPDRQSWTSAHSLPVNPRPPNVAAEITRAMAPRPPPTQQFLWAASVSAHVIHYTTRLNHIRLFASYATRVAGQSLQHASGSSGSNARPPRRQQTNLLATLRMASGARAASSADKPAEGEKKKKKTRPAPTEPRPSASVVILSPTNQVLLLHRVSTSSAFPSAHVFPGGNLSDFHDGAVPPPGDGRRHEDSLPYRLGAIRETFEESGILLARKGGPDGPLLELPAEARERARKAIYQNEVRFVDWLRSVGGVADTDNLIPFTRWITPAAQPKRFTTQMYIYMLPLSLSPANPSIDDALPPLSVAEATTPTPTHDGGVEITAARFDDAAAWLARQRQGSPGSGDADTTTVVMMFPPQCVLLHLLSGILTTTTAGGEAEMQRERERLRRFVSAVPTPPAVGGTGTGTGTGKKQHRTAWIPWGEKVISPVTLGRARDGRTILGLDRPGAAELEEAGRGGDWERVVLVRWERGQARDIEVRGREEVLAEQREAEKEKEKASKL
ncbi:hypothetical protein F5X96DRAFT_660550 [Biscogniauxia mediterranea]|nr:hypothetical protein F5X96DRAFT_660550 [Biscogniauxia mediterranea]